MRVAPFEFGVALGASHKEGLGLVNHEHKQHIPNSEVLERLPKAVAATAEPMMSHDVIAFYLLSERVSKDVKVVLARQGANEVFGGYFWYPLMETENGPAVEVQAALLRQRPCPALSRGLIPDAVIDRPYFPVPALKHVRGPFLELMRGILQSDACLKRGLYQRAYIDEMLANPEAHFTRIQGSKLWHLALLEWWLQVHVDGVA